MLLIFFFSVGWLTEARCIPEVWLGVVPPSAFTKLSLSHPTFCHHLTPPFSLLCFRHIPKQGQKTYNGNNNNFTRYLHPAKLWYCSEDTAICVS